MNGLQYIFGAIVYALAFFGLYSAYCWRIIWRNEKNRTEKKNSVTKSFEIYDLGEINIESKEFFRQFTIEGKNPVFTPADSSQEGRRMRPKALSRDREVRPVKKGRKARAASGASEQSRA